MIEIQNLTKTYRGGVQALAGIDLTIGPGMFGLVGPNGAGKTTLMRILAGLLNPTGGQVRAFGNDMRSERGRQALKAMLGYLPQELGFYPTLTGREFLDYIAIMKGITDAPLRRRQIADVLEKLELIAVADRRLSTYSGGMKRRVGIAQALLGAPALLIVDEPTVGLDPEQRVRIRNLLADAAQRSTVILSTHIIEDISHSCNDLAMITAGRVLFRGSPRELIQSARGHVWHVLGNGFRPDGLRVVSTLQLADSVQYRVIGNVASGIPATPVEPSLEDGYIWAMQQSGQPSADS